MRSALAAWLAAALFLAACAPAPVTVPEPPGVGVAAPAGPESWLLPGTEWRLVELDGAPFPARATAELTTDGRIVGQAPCNRFTATWTGRWPELAFSPAVATEIACPELEAEAAFFAALERVNHAEVGEAGLLLTGPDGTRLRFERIG